MDRLDQLRIFVRVAQSGGFTLAADQLALPRPTVSLAVQQLELRLGTRLFNRTTRRVSLTPDGITLLERCQRLLADADELEHLFRPAIADLRGRLRVELPSRIARRYVAPELPDFFQRYPGIELEVRASDRAVDLVQEGVDCALRVGTVATSSLVARPLGQLRQVHCASPMYLARHGTPQHPNELSQHRIIQYASPTNGRSALWEWTADGQTHALAMPATVSTNNVETYIACGLAGMGMIQVPAFDVQHDLVTGALQEILTHWPPPSMPVQLLYPHRPRLSHRVQVFSDWLQALLQPALKT